MLSFHASFCMANTQNQLQHSQGKLQNEQIVQQGGRRNRNDFHCHIYKELTILNPPTTQLKNDKLLTEPSNHSWLFLLLTCITRSCTLISFQHFKYISKRLTSNFKWPNYSFIAFYSYVKMQTGFIHLHIHPCCALCALPMPFSSWLTSTITNPGDSKGFPAHGVLSTAPCEDSHGGDAPSCLVQHMACVCGNDG